MWRLAPSTGRWRQWRRQTQCSTCAGRPPPAKQWQACLANRASALVWMAEVRRLYRERESSTHRGQDARTCCATRSPQRGGEGGWPGQGEGQDWDQAPCMWICIYIMIPILIHQIFFFFCMYHLVHTKNMCLGNTHTCTRSYLIT
jgi:hypothetical protein